MIMLIINLVIMLLCVWYSDQVIIKGRFRTEKWRDFSLFLLFFLFIMLMINILILIRSV